MGRNSGVLAAKGGFIAETYRDGGVSACVRKLVAAVRMSLPLVALGRRTNGSVGAYFDLITDDARMFYGDNFHFGYFRRGDESFAEALDAHTDAVADMANLSAGKRVLDIGCGIGAPALRIAARHGCSIVGINISGEQVKQGKSLVEGRCPAGHVELRQGNALALDFPDGTFDSIICIEVAGDICVKSSQKRKLVAEMRRVLKPGGFVGFSDLVFTGSPTRSEERAMRAILYHDGAELVTDWPGLFEAGGFEVTCQRDIIAETMPMWSHSLAIYEDRAGEVERRYGKGIAEKTMAHLKAIPAIMERYGSFILLSACKPS